MCIKEKNLCFQDKYFGGESIQKKKKSVERIKSKIGHYLFTFLREVGKYRSEITKGGRRGFGILNSDN